MRLSLLRRTAAVLTAGALALTPAVANADDGNLPSQAPEVQVGVTYYGDNTKNCQTETSCTTNGFWRLPPLLAQDRVQVAIAVDADVYLNFCLTGNVDDFDWSQNRCNIAGGVSVSDMGAREAFFAREKAEPAFLQVYTGGFGRSGGPYHFVVEKIQHAVGVAVPTDTMIRPTGTLEVTPNLTDGSELPDGIEFELVIKVKKVVSSVVAQTADGNVVFTYDLPPVKNAKKAKVQVLLEETSEYQAAASPTAKLTYTP